MKAYVDESGVNKVDGHSTVACVLTTNDLEIESKVKQIEKYLNIENLHWKDMSWKVRGKAIDKIIDLDIFANVLVLENPNNVPKYMSEYIPKLIEVNKIDGIYIDWEKGKNFKNAFKSSLRANGLSTRDLHFVSSKDNSILRVADIVAGCVRYYYDKHDNKNILPLYKKLKKKIIKLEIVQK